ncbi:protein of unknown function [Candidatus Methylomirabilis oxygeniifera]|uniref:Uncharacterized protein n=1 Tax=Methylomirabilis oxygeniifera TaxID=671143 RepID=D5MFI6_METO1|nr:protein of unknown function [Candidatus Methylomirabilis oxyfera]
MRPLSAGLQFGRAKGVLNRVLEHEESLRIGSFRFLRRRPIPLAGANVKLSVRRYLFLEDPPFLSQSYAYDMV